MEKLVKPIGQRSYGSIPHLPGSRLGSGDHHISHGQSIIATTRKRDKHDVIIVQEKLDGSNVGVAKVNGEIIAITRSGYIADSSPYLQHHIFDKWVKKNYSRFDHLLNEGERICGEWLAMAHSTRYNLPHEPFVPFDIMLGIERAPYCIFVSRIEYFGFTPPNLLHMGDSFSIDQMLAEIKVSGHGAIEDVEGAIWRIERHGKVDFLTKFVCHDKRDGKYFQEHTGKDPVWNIDISEYL